MRVRTRLFVGLTVAATVLLASAVAAQALAPRLHARRLASALNRGDLGAIAAMLSEDVVFVGCEGPGTVATGKQAVLDRCFGPDIANNAHVDLSDVSDVVDTFMADFEFTSDQTRAAGVERVVGEFEGVVDEEADLITRMSVFFDTGDEQTREFLAGAQAAGPTRLPQTGDGSLASNGSAMGLAGTIALAGAAAGLFAVRRRRKV